MNLKDLIYKFKTPKKPKTEDEIKKELEEKKELALIKAGKLTHLIKDKTGWKEFNDLLEDYIDACNIRKLKTRLDNATPETLQKLKYMDRDVYLLKWVQQIPQQFIAKTIIKNIPEEKEKE